MENIYLDFDGLKFNTTPLLMAYMNEKYSINSILGDYLNKGSSLDKILYSYRPDLMDITREKVYLDYAHEFLVSVERHAGIEPIDGMLEVVPLLARKYNIYVVTARQESGKQVIRHILDKFVPDCVIDIHCVWLHYNDEYIKRPKIEFVKATTGKHIAFFDDSIDEIHEMQNFIPSYLFNPLGANNDLSRVKNVVSSWYEFGEKFL